ncbi:hypothetical protein SARC_10820 [Sphaeroforma arctica JP610]|uniref:Methyltransferase domain-containing protein n=1 Tax=Sphaeroforma arctica JP610 TaxID=667725 RepID=A0A0L0FIT6_9EUKA|nr:hypothetical protein SARC_10820 [Sphaeroforma arctica JP610]KNC76692.1 hypothetical protein SARC_10820 [Sphaeroforma arctica JP610]|eukprot:XP_014150594.1 hypothetical protein SARC_10820 [Sphaeroforma arctica JP610]
MISDQSQALDAEQNAAVDCPWGSDNACIAYNEILEKYDFHNACNRYSTATLCGDVSGLSVLDLPSGPGCYALYFLGNGAKAVTSVDLDANFVKEAGEKIKRLPPKSQHAWQGLVANACIPQMYAQGPFDLIRASFVMEVFPTLDLTRACLQNLYDNLKPGGRIVSITASGAHTPEDGKVVLDTVGMATTDLTKINPGDPVDCTYVKLSTPTTISWLWRPEEQLRKVLQEVGFSDICFQRLLVDPQYSGPDDLETFVNHVGNRIVTATKR